MENNILSVVDLNFYINSKQILKDININLQTGELVGIIGPNGAGKSTLLKCLNGINKFEGNIFIKDKNIKDYSEKLLAQNISLMNQKTDIQFPFTCKDVICMGRYPYMKNGQLLSKEDKNIIAKYIEYMNISDLVDREINQLSGGERQRVLFTKTLVQETDIFLFDEPTSNLDIKYQEDIFKYMKSLAEHNKLVITTVHDLKSAIKYCSKLILLKDGKIISLGDINEVITKENMLNAYDIDIFIYKNELTDTLDFCMEEDIVSHRIT